MIRLTITPDGGEPYNLTVGSRDVAAWERGGADRRVDDVLRESRFVHVYQLAHIAAVRVGRFVGDLASFEATHELRFGHQEEAGDDDEGEGDAADPTETAPGGGSPAS